VIAPKKDKLRECEKQILTTLDEIEENEKKNLEIKLKIKELEYKIKLTKERVRKKTFYTGWVMIAAGSLILISHYTPYNIGNSILLNLIYWPTCGYLIWKQWNS